MPEVDCDRQDKSCCHSQGQVVPFFWLKDLCCVTSFIGYSFLKFSWNQFLIKKIFFQSNYRAQNEDYVNSNFLSESVSNKYYFIDETMMIMTKK